MDDSINAGIRAANMNYWARCIVGGFAAQFMRTRPSSIGICEQHVPATAPTSGMQRKCARVHTMSCSWSGPKPRPILTVGRKFEGLRAWFEGGPDFPRFLAFIRVILISGKFQKLSIFFFDERNIFGFFVQKDFQVFAPACFLSFEI
jgi:hypothetical protein